MHTPALAVLAAVLAISLSADATAQAYWHTPEGFSRLGGFAAHDPQRGVTVVFGASSDHWLNETWQWDGAAWTDLHAPLPLPYPTFAGQGLCGMVYDVARQRLVLVGIPGNYGISVWEFVAGGWQLVSSTLPAQAEYSGSVAYDPIRSVTVIHMLQWGSSGTDTFEWNGTTLAHQPVTSPPAGVGLQFLPDRGRVAAFTTNETWEYTGSAWTLTSAAAGLPQRLGGAILAFDPIAGHAVLFGGSVNYGSLPPTADLWEYVGNSWTLRPDPTPPPGRSAAIVCGDATRQRLLVSSGMDLQQLRGDTWEWDGSSWTLRADASGPPVYNHAMCFDPVRGEMLVFGGSTNQVLQDGTWRRGANGWQQLLPLHAPSARVAAAMTFDTQRGRMILFGGVDAQGQLLVDTWEWNGSDWQAGPSGPTVAVGSLPTLAFDRSRARTVFFGGGDRNADTWEYDGTSWSLVSRLFPPNQQDAHLVYDPNSERILLISIGISGVSVWIWDGVNWASTSPSTRPPTTAWLAVHDSARERTLLQQVTWSSYGATWEWDGTTWAQTNAFDNFAYRSASAIAYDEWAGHIVTYGGLANFTSPLLALPYASEYYTDAPARYDSFGIGCAGAALPTLNSLGLPWNGAAFTAVVENLPPTSLAVLHTGFSDSSYGGISLPFSLASMGWPGCAALVGPEVVVPLTAVAGSASVAFTIPTNAALIGLQFFQQALALQVQSGSLAVTAGRAGTIGVR